MKTPPVKPVWKFLAGLLIYVIVIAVLSLFDDYRIVIYGFMLMNAAAFGMSLWVLCKNKSVVALALAASLALTPAQAGEQPPEKEAVAFIAGCGIIIVGGVIVYILYKVCKKLPAPPKKKGNPPSTNPEPESVVGPIPLNSPAPPLLMPDTDISETPIDYEVLTIAFQSSTNGADWLTEYTATNWFGPDRVFSVLYSNNVPLMTNQMQARWTNETFLMDFSAVMPTKETLPFRQWRGVQLQ